jgi:hypothetical protein
MVAENTINSKAMSETGSIGRRRGIARLAARSVIYASIITLVDSAILTIFDHAIPRPMLTLVLFLEGGLGLLAGVGISLSSTPSMARIGEELFRTSSWSKKSQRHAEIVGLKWMLVSAFLVIIGFVVSAL